MFLKALVLFLITTLPSLAVTLGWQGIVTNNLAGYCLYVGKESGIYTNKIYVDKNTTNITVSVYPPAYFAVSAFTTDGIESDNSPELAFLDVTFVTNIIEKCYALGQQWIQVTSFVYSITTTNEFFRLRLVKQSLMTPLPPSLMHAPRIITNLPPPLPK